MQRNGIRSRGLIDQFESVEIDVKKSCEIVGDELVKKGLFEDAVKLYDLADVSVTFIKLNFIPILLWTTCFFLSTDWRTMFAIFVDSFVSRGSSAKQEGLVAWTPVSEGFGILGALQWLRIALRFQHSSYILYTPRLGQILRWISRTKVSACVGNSEQTETRPVENARFGNVCQ